MRKRRGKTVKQNCEGVERIAKEKERERESKSSTYLLPYLPTNLSAPH